MDCSDQSSLKNSAGVGYDTSLKVTEDRVKMSKIQKTMVNKLQRVWQTVPMVSNCIEVDVVELLALREKLNTEYAIENIKFGITDIMLKILGNAMAQNPKANAYIDGEDMVYRKSVNIGLAVATEAGLMVPIIRDVDKKDIKQIGLEKRDLIKRSQVKKLKLDELTGGCLTLSNMGSFRAEAFTPILNMSETCIVGLGQIKEKPVVINDQIVIRQMMWLNYTYDHRVMDGALAASLLNSIRDAVEKPLMVFHDDEQPTV